MTSEAGAGAGGIPDLRVLELAEGVAGPVAGKMFAAQGAEVIKIERPGDGDATRRAGPFPGDSPDPAASGLFHYLNMGKQGVTLNLHCARGRDLLLRLAGRADVLITDLTAGEQQALGLSYGDFEAVNERLVVTSVTPFGLSGPYSEFKAPEVVIRALSGEMYLAGEPDKPPLMKGLHVAQFHGGAHAYIGATAALYERARSGRGQLVDVSVAEGWASVAGLALKSYSYTGDTPGRGGASLGFPSGLRRCADGWAMIGRRAGREWWNSLVEVVDDPEMQDEKFSTPASRAERTEELSEILDRWMAGMPKREVFDRAQRAGLPAGYVCDADDLLASPQLQFREFFAEAPLPGGHGFSYPSRPWLTDAIPWRNGPPPRLGQHNAEVYGQVLGLREDELQALASEGVI